MPVGKPGKFSTMDGQLYYSSTMYPNTRTIRGGCQLTSSSEAIGHKSFKEHRVQVGARQINRGRVSSRTRAYDDLEHTTDSIYKQPD